MSMGFSAHVGLMLSFLYAGISDVMRKWVCFGAYAVTPVTYFGVVLCCVCVGGGW
jgi:hypothetical protein